MADSKVPLILDRDESILTITMNRPDRLNAFDPALIGALFEALQTAANDRSIRGVVLTGAGRAFCAGGDLSALREMDPAGVHAGFMRLAGEFHQAVIEIRTMDKPVIGAINGAAAGGGFSIALACDLRVMAENAFLQQAYTRAGLSLDGGGSFSLPRLVGIGRALEIVMLDDRINAEKALELGLVNRVCAPEACLSTAQELAARIARGPVGSYGRCKRLLNRAFDRSLETQMEDERRAIAESGDSAEGREGMAAFIEKRTADFVGAGG